MILTAGVLCCNQKCDFCHQKQNKRGIIYNNYTCPCPGGGQDNRVSVLSSHDDILHRYSNLSNSPEKIHVIFLMSAWLQTRLSLAPEQARKQLVKTCNKY